MRAELVQRVRDEVGAVASLRRVDIVAALPKTRSGKVLRKTMRELADGKDPAVPSTIEDPACSTPSAGAAELTGRSVSRRDDGSGDGLGVVVLAEEVGLEPVDLHDVRAEAGRGAQGVRPGLVAEP